MSSNTPENRIVDVDLPQDVDDWNSACATKNLNEKSQPQHHEAQWERQGEWLCKLRAYKAQLVEEQGLKGWELWEAMATLSLDHKIATLQSRNNRCAHCWHDQHYCICAQLEGEPIDELSLQKLINFDATATTRFKLCLLMHHKEYLGAGNSAKLVLQLLPQQTELYLYGKTGEFDRLLEEIVGENKDTKDTMILWPGAEALSVSEFLSRRQDNGTNASNNGDTKPRSQTDGDIFNEPRMIRAVVLDGTYSQARNMYKSLRKRMRDKIGSNDSVATVAINPKTSSVFHRAQKNYGQAHKQQQHNDEDEVAADISAKHPYVTRISTAEACGWLLRDLGADQSIPQRITDAVVLNNNALAFARTEHPRQGQVND